MGTYCKTCGKENKDGYKFCVYCGGTLEPSKYSKNEEQVVDSSSSNEVEKVQPSNVKKGLSFSEENEFPSSKINTEAKSNLTDIPGSSEIGDLPDTTDIPNVSNSAVTTDTSDSVAKKTNFFSANKKALIIAGIVIFLVVIAVIIIVAVTGNSNSSSYDDYDFFDSYDDYSYDDNGYYDDEEETSEEDTTSESNGYIRSFDDLDENVAEQFIDFARGYYESEDFGKYEHPSLEYVGNIVLVNKNSDDGSMSFVHNKLVIIYRVSMRITHSYGDKTTDFYWFMGFNNVNNYFDFLNNYQEAKDHPSYFRPNKSVRLVGPVEDPWEYRGQFSVSDLKAEELNDSNFEIVEENID